MPDINQLSTEIDDMIRKYSPNIPVYISQKKTTGSLVVLLTGSTGGLGSNMLASMVPNSRFKRIYALNRTPLKEASIQDRHKETFKKQGLDVSLISDEKIVYLCGDTTKDRLGLTAPTYEELHKSVNLVVHNAWRVGLGLSLARFEPNIRGMRNLIDFALTSPDPSAIRFLFISSVSSGLNWKVQDGPLPEKLIADSRVGLGLGYGAGKYVAETLLGRSGLNSTSIRLTQVVGNSATGAWSTTEWFPMMIKTSLYLGYFPLSLGVVSWIPIDVAAKCVVDLCLAEENSDRVLNLAHPRPLSWEVMMRTIIQELPRQQSISFPHNAHILVHSSEWALRFLKSRYNATWESNIENIPAAKVMDFVLQGSRIDSMTTSETESFGIPMVSTERMQLLSPSLKSLPQLLPKDVKAWVAYWKRSGYLKDPPATKL